MTKVHPLWWTLLQRNAHRCSSQASRVESVLQGDSASLGHVFPLGYTPAEGQDNGCSPPESLITLALCGHPSSRYA